MSVAGRGGGVGGGPTGGGDAAAAHTSAAEEAGALLREDVAALRELSALEAASRWPVLAIAQALELLLPRPGCAGREDAEVELVGLYARLGGMDPQHAAYYAHCAGKVRAGSA